VKPFLGTAFFSEHGQDEDTLLRNAYTAMSYARRMGKGRSAYSPLQQTGTG